MTTYIFTHLQATVVSLERGRVGSTSQPRIFRIFRSHHSDSILIGDDMNDNKTLMGIYYPHYGSLYHDGIVMNVMISNDQLPFTRPAHPGPLFEFSCKKKKHFG